MKPPPIIRSFLIGALALLTACNLGGTPATSPSSVTDTLDSHQIDQAIAATFAAQTQIAVYVQQTMTALALQNPAPTATPPVPPPPAATPTPNLPMVTVSTETNCRSGPGQSFAILGVLNPGETAEVMGRTTVENYWLVRNPDNPAQVCWLWGEYATVTGDWQSLPQATPPPTPTPTQPSTITITIYNNCGSTIFYAYISDSADPSWGSDELGASTIPLNGTFSWVYNPGTYDVKVEDASHNVLHAWYNMVMTADQYLVACP